MNYQVTTIRFSDAHAHKMQVKRYNNLAGAKRHAFCMVRKLGNVNESNWGATGGDFPKDYRRSVITTA